MIIRLLSYFVFILIVFQVAAQSKNEVVLKATIKVFDKQKKKLDGISVIYTDLKTNQVLSKTTAKGTVQINLPIDRDYLIMISHQDYYTKTISIDTEVKRLGYETIFYTDIDVYLFYNCENDPSKSHLIDHPIGRIEYNNLRQKFQYDFAYTSSMTELYNHLVEERCNGDLYEDVAYDIFEEDNPKVISEDLIILPEKIDTHGMEMKREHLAVVNKTGNDRFDHNKGFIYLHPRHSWPSELRNYLLDSGYVSRPIGTYAYTESEGKKDFYIEDVAELRVKFPKEFDDAFPNWDYIVKTYSEYGKQ